MIPQILNVLQKLRTNLWVVPLVMSFSAAALAIAAVSVRLGPGRDPVWYLYSGNAEDAPQFLSHLVSSMITMATLAITITMVVLTLAAQQLGPRLIQSFMRDRFVQISLGVLIGTVVYLLLVLRHTYGLKDDTPNLAVTLGTVMVLVSIVFLLLLLHYLARSIISDNVVQTVGATLDSEIDRLLPEKDASETSTPASIHADGMSVHATGSGYVQAIDFDKLFTIACSAECTVELAVRAGHHVIAHGTVGWIAPTTAKQDTQRAIADCVIIGNERTAAQDLEFSIRHLVEVAVRALSPGINDPYTAIAVIDRLAQSIGRVMERGAAQSVWMERNGTPRIIAPVSTFGGIVDAAFNQIRQRAAQSPDVLIRLADKLAALIALADAPQRAELAKHLRLVLEAGRRNIKDEPDLKALEDRAAPGLRPADRLTP